MNDHEGYKQSLLKILDMARESHWYLLDRVTVRQFDLAKTYLWVSSVIGAIVMFVVKELTPFTTASMILIIWSVFFACVSFVLSMSVLWGHLWGKTLVPLTEPLNLAEFAYEQFLEAGAPDSTVYAGIIRSINDANLLQRATNTRRANILTIAAPCFVLSFLCLMTSVVLRIINA